MIFVANRSARNDSCNPVRTTLHESLGTNHPIFEKNLTRRLLEQHLFYSFARNISRHRSSHPPLDEFHRSRRRHDIECPSHLGKTNSIHSGEAYFRMHVGHLFEKHCERITRSATGTEKLHDHRLIGIRHQLVEVVLIELHQPHICPFMTKNRAPILRSPAKLFRKGVPRNRTRPKNGRTRKTRTIRKRLRLNGATCAAARKCRGCPA